MEVSENGFYYHQYSKCREGRLCYSQPLACRENHLWANWKGCFCKLEEVVPPPFPICTPDYSPCLVWTSVLCRIANLHVAAGELLLLQLVFRQQRSVPLEEIVTLEGRL